MDYTTISLPRQVFFPGGDRIEWTYLAIMFGVTGYIAYRLTRHVTGW